MNATPPIPENAPRLDPEEILTGILEWVAIESPSNDGGAVSAMVDRVASDFYALGFPLQRESGRDGYGDILTARTPWGDDGPGILVLCHVDTVHPLGTLDGPLSPRREGDKVYGPGIYDMKGGAYLAFSALRHLVRLGERTPLPVTVMFVPEEEAGSPISREAIEQAARASKYVLVTEPARAGGKVVTARRGAARYTVRALGRAAHSGLRHQDGRSAIREMARQILRFEALTDYVADVTCNVGLVSGGTGSNVVPAECRAEVDVRLPNPEAAKRICADIAAFEPYDPEVTLEISGGLNRPPYEKDAGIARLFAHAHRLAQEIGFELEDMKTGGGSDGNFTAALGVPTLDGLGVDGDGAHQPDEHLYVSSLLPRTRLLLGLLRTLR